MAKCDLTIELDHPDAVHDGGGKVTGLVRVDVDADVNCKSLQVKSVWRTHGRGNVASGVCETLDLYAGPWMAGESKEYRFELSISQWPPSYHGHYLNIDHYVDARASIPWGFDPKASVPFLMRPTCGRDGARVVRKTNQAGPLVSAIVAAVLLGLVGFFLFMLSQMGWFAIVFLAVPVIGGLVWFVRVVLPRYLLGDVQCDLSSAQAVPGESIAGELVIRPRKNVNVNSVSINFQALEKCISGSGSNRTTHKHVFYENAETLQSSTTLQAGQEHRFPFAVSLPHDAPYSVDLSDNDLIWSSKIRIDIPRWPDWTKDVPLQVVPAGTDAGTERHDRSAVRLPAAPTPQAETADMVAEDELTFDETAGHLWTLRDRRDDVESLVEAVTGLSFQIAAVVERRLLYSGDDDPHVYHGGYAVWAHYPDPPLPMVLYVPHALADEFEQVGAAQWRGQGTIVGWDATHGRLQVKIDLPR